MSVIMRVTAALTPGASWVTVATRPHGINCGC